jgi:hypothetical protein
MDGWMDKCMVNMRDKICDNWEIIKENRIK